jgi:hypothetical protein
VAKVGSRSGVGDRRRRLLRLLRLLLLLHLLRRRRWA